MRKLILLLAFSPCLIFGQNIILETFSSGGSHHNSNNIFLDWTLGEMVSESVSIEDVKLTQGLHQGKLEISTKVIDLNSEFNYNVYPIPADQVLFIETEKIENQRLVLYNILGTQFIHTFISKNKTSLDLSSLPQGIYFLSIYSDQVISNLVSVEVFHY